MHFNILCYFSSCFSSGTTLGVSSSQQSDDALVLTAETGAVEYVDSDAEEITYDESIHSEDQVSSSSISKVLRKFDGQNLFLRSLALKFI